MIRLALTFLVTSSVCAGLYAVTDGLGDPVPRRVFDPPLRADEPRVPSDALVTDLAWPSALAPLTEQRPVFPPRARKWRIYLDAGHGAPRNSGAVSAFCEDEQDHTLRVAHVLAAELERTGRFTVRLSRGGAMRPTYASRVADAEAWPADAFVSLHMDWRGANTLWEPMPGKRCLRQDHSPGFGVLWNDDAKTETLRAQRVALARAVASRITATGLLPYDGYHWQSSYDGDQTPGVFVDRHPPGARIYVLRRPQVVPSIIIETHNALDVRETTRWREARVLDAFSKAVAAGLADYFTSTPGDPLLASGEVKTTQPVR